jgi:hypothetical protein
MRPARGSGSRQAINCGAIPEALFESVLFGHARGAFTSAVQANPGLVSSADRGTLFLDEVGEIPLHLQVKLLRFIEDKEAWAVGRTKPVRVDCRIAASTNRDLRRELTAGRFRDDLFYRLKVVHLTVPPLRERDDIPLLVEHRSPTPSSARDPRRQGGPPRADGTRLARKRPSCHVAESAMIERRQGRDHADDLPSTSPLVRQRSLKEAARSSSGSDPRRWPGPRSTSGSRAPAGSARLALSLDGKAPDGQAPASLENENTAAGFLHR